MKELYTWKLLNPIIQDPSIGIGGLKEIVFHDLVNLISYVSSAFLWVCSKGVSQILVIESKNSSVSFLGRIILSSFIQKFLISWQVYLSFFPLKLTAS